MKRKTERKAVKRPASTEEKSPGLFVRPKDAASMLACSKQAIWNMLDDGRLWAIKIGVNRIRNHVRIYRQSVLDLCAARKTAEGKGG